MIAVGIGVGCPVRVIGADFEDHALTLWRRL
jgi:hypothetical protein